MTFPWLSMTLTFAIFHDFPGLENDLPKFHDFLWPGGTLYRWRLEGPKLLPCATVSPTWIGTLESLNKGVDDVKFQRVDVYDSSTCTSSAICSDDVTFVQALYIRTRVPSSVFTDRVCPLCQIFLAEIAFGSDLQVGQRIIRVTKWNNKHFQQKYFPLLCGAPCKLCTPSAAADAARP